MGLKSFIKNKLIELIRQKQKQYQDETRNRIDQITHQLEEAYKILEQISIDVSGIAENIRVNNKTLESHVTMILSEQKNLQILNMEMKTIHKMLIEKPESKGMEYWAIDYLNFENYFRGSMEATKQTQLQYIKYFEGKSNVLDLGCGRGEFLELLKENNIEAKGADLYPGFVELCRSKNLKVDQVDALTYLRDQDFLGGIFAGQLIEHLNLGRIMELCELAYEKLEDGACLILETPNPRTLSIFSNAFYIDPSHQKPIHPLTMEYLLRMVGFQNIEVVYTENSRCPECIPKLEGENIANLEQFNSSIDEVNNLLFGSQDYAIIARK